MERLHCYSGDGRVKKRAKSSENCYNMITSEKQLLDTDVILPKKHTIKLLGSLKLIRGEEKVRMYGHSVPAMKQKNRSIGRSYLCKSK